MQEGEKPTKAQKQSPMLAKITDVLFLLHNIILCVLSLVMGFGHIEVVSKALALQDQSFLVRTVCDPGRVLFKQVRVSKNNVSLFCQSDTSVSPLELDMSCCSPGCSCTTCRSSTSFLIPCLSLYARFVLHADAHATNAHIHTVL